MKHRLMVLASVCLVVLVSTGFAFAASSGRVGNPSGQQQAAGLPRCATVQIPIFIDITSPLGAWGLPLTISGGAQILSATPDPALAGLGFATASGGFPGTSGVLNIVGGCLPAPGTYPNLWTLTIQTPDSCAGNIVIDTGFFPPAGAFVVLDCGGCAYGQFDWFKGEFTLENQSPICGDNSAVTTVHFAGPPVSRQLNASDPDACDNPLEYHLDNAGGLNGTAAISLGGLFTYTASCSDKGTHTVTFHATDQCGASTPPCTFQVTVTNSAPVCTPATTNENNVYYQTGVVNKPLGGSDPDGDPKTYSLVSIVSASNVGVASITPAGVFNYATVCGDVGTHTVNFRISDGCDSVDCSFTVTVHQNPPVPTCPANASVNWNAPNQVYGLSATDDGCVGPVTWSFISAVPAPANLPSVVGSNVNFNPECSDVALGPITIAVRASDGQLTADCSFQVTVTNDAPVITCPANQFTTLGGLVSASASANDVDPVTFTLVSFTALEGQGAPTNAPSLIAGAFSWQTSDASSNDAGLWEACISVADGCGGTDECCFQIDVLSYALCIRDSSGSATIPILNGQQATAYVTLSNSYPLGGIDLLICYDVSGLSFINAFAVDELANWEYFTWRHSPNSNCQGSCPSGYIRIIAIADLDNGPAHHPAPADFYLSGEIVGLVFNVTSDRNFINQCLNVGFCVLDCGDNALSSVSGDTLFIPIGSPEECIDTTKQEAIDLIEFCPGIICIKEPPDDRGDINLNGLANEIGDAVLFTNYFVYGSSVWDPVWEDVQILATDINDDGIVLTVADLIYLVRIITGDEQPFPPGTGNGSPKLSPYANSGTATVRVENGRATVSTSSNVDLGGALLVFRYNGLSTGEPTLLSGADGMKMLYSATANELRVLIHPSWNDGIATIGSGTNEILSIPTSGEGTFELAEVQMSDARGALMSTSAAKSVVPTSYALQQNYPNPFNAGTVMSFDLVKDANWTLTIYNVAGQTVREFNGLNAAGNVRVAWDGHTADGMTASSGVYFYRVSANGFTATKKMTLMK